MKKTIFFLFFAFIAVTGLFAAGYQEKMFDNGNTYVATNYGDDAFYTENRTVEQVASLFKECMPMFEIYDVQGATYEELTKVFGKEKRFVNGFKYALKYSNRTGTCVQVVACDQNDRVTHWLLAKCSDGWVIGFEDEGQLSY